MLGVYEVTLRVVADSPFGIPAAIGKLQDSDVLMVMTSVRPLDAEAERQYAAAKKLVG